MIRNKDFKSKYPYAFVAALLLHAAIFAFIKGDVQNIDFLTNLSNHTKTLSRPIKLDEIKVISPAEVERVRRVGIKDGKKNLDRPDLGPILPPIARPQAPMAEKKETPKNQKGGASTPQPQVPALSLKNLAPTLPKPDAKPPKAQTAPSPLAREMAPSPADDNGGHFFYSYNKNKQKIIPRSAEQEILKTEATKGYTPPMNKATERISNFEIRYERPEGVSEDELNSDEKAYYSFYVRSYKNYFSKIYANYEKIVVERPGLSKVFDSRHLLIGKIDYDENGNIVTVKILKSDDNDDLAYFFEETLKQLNQPNPPRVFTKNRKQFSIYYQIQIN